MRIEASLVDQNVAKKSSRRQRKSMPHVVQRLFNTCKEVFSSGGANVVPSPAEVERLRSVLDGMKPKDVGLREDMPYFRTAKTKEKSRIAYVHLYECDKFSIGIFCLPPKGVIPLHNHPGMTVFSKLLFGSMHIKSYDWADIPCTSDKTLNTSHRKDCGMRLAKVKMDAVFTAPCNTSILYPAAGGNMHCFTAMTSCAVLDVLGPPYADSEDRPCTYFRDFPYTSFSVDADAGCEGGGDGYAWLEQREKPEDFSVVGAKYRGPKIVDH